MTEQEIRILVADDSNLFREAIVSFVSTLPGMVLIGVATTGEQAVRIAKVVRPDVVVMDAYMPGIGGLEAARQLHRMDDAPAVLLVAANIDDALIAEAHRIPVHTLLLKRDAGRRLEATIRDAAAKRNATTPSRLRSPSPRPAGRGCG
jgi:DNA-binding NarL/FixJ family response regulator